MRWALLAERRWLWLTVILGLMFHLWSIYSSDVGLDTHVRLVADGGSGTNPALPWGGLRHADHSSLGAGSVAYSGWVFPWTNTPLSFQLSSLGAVVGLMLVMALPLKHQMDKARFDPVWMIPVACSPVLVFSTGRGYDEAMLALVMTVCLWWAWKTDDLRPQRPLPIYISLAFGCAVSVLWKGLGWIFGGLVFVVIILASLAWDRWWLSGCEWRGATRSTVHQHMLLGGFAAVAGVSVVGAILAPGSFSIIAERPLAYALSVLVAMLVGPALYLLIGCLVWPFLRVVDRTTTPSWTTAYLAVFSGCLLGAIAAYTAVLWTFESQLWEASLLETMVRLGNNGRYVTLVLPPVLLMLKSAHGISRTLPTASHRDLFVAVVAMVPFLLFVSMVGHQLWSVDAGEAMDNVLSEDQTFILIAEPSLAMHHLYTMKATMDVDGELNMTGVWVSEASFASQPFTNDSAAAILVGPNIDLDLAGQGWLLTEQSKVPLHVPGIQTGTWRLYVPA